MSFKNAFSFIQTPAFQSHLIRHHKVLRIILTSSPQQFKIHIKDCVINKRMLLIYVDSSAWASQLRFLSAQLQNAVNKESSEKIEKIRIRVMPSNAYQLKKTNQKIIPSAENIELLRNNAASISESKLKNALLNLSDTLQKYHS